MNFVCAVDFGLVCNAELYSWNVVVVAFLLFTRWFAVWKEEKWVQKLLLHCYIVARNSASPLHRLWTLFPPSEAEEFESSRESFVHVATCAARCDHARLVPRLSRATRIGPSLQRCGPLVLDCKHQSPVQTPFGQCCYWEICGKMQKVLYRSLRMLHTFCTSESRSWVDDRDRDDSTFSNFDSEWVCQGSSLTPTFSVKRVLATGHRLGVRSATCSETTRFNISWLRQNGGMPLECWECARWVASWENPCRSWLLLTGSNATGVQEILKLRLARIAESRA